MLARIANSMLRIGSNIGHAARPQAGASSRNGDFHFAGSDQKDLFVRMVVWRMRLSARRKGGFMQLDEKASMRGTFEHRPELILPLPFDREALEGIRLGRKPFGW